MELQAPAGKNCFCMHKTEIVLTTNRTIYWNDYIMKIRSLLIHYNNYGKIIKSIAEEQLSFLRAIKIKWTSTYLEQYKVLLSGDRAWTKSFLQSPPAFRFLEYFYPIEISSDTSNISPFTYFSTSCTIIALNHLYLQFFLVFFPLNPSVLILLLPIPTPTLIPVSSCTFTVPIPLHTLIPEFLFWNRKK